ncbi:hypothetical protein V2J09_018184 [Rumex salicifolius]
MELMRPSNPQGTVVDRFLRLSSSSPGYGGELDRTSRHVSSSSSSSRLSEVAEEGDGDEIVFVAVGKSVDKVVALLQWTFHKFGSCPVCLAHVHQPSSTIPTLLGKLPATQANPAVVAAHRNEEWETTKKLLDIYSSLCSRRKVKASIKTTEAEQVQTGLVDLINKHHIRKLVMGDVPKNWMSVKKSSSIAIYTAKSAPPFCKIWFVHKGKHIWTREASDGLNLDAVICQSDIVREEGLRSKSSRYHKTDLNFYDEKIRLSSSRVNTTGTKDWNQDLVAEREDEFLSPQPLSSSIIKSDQRAGSSYYVNNTSNGSACTSSGDGTSDSELKSVEEMLFGHLAEVKAEEGRLKHEAYMESMKREQLEAEAAHTIMKVKDFEDAHAREVKQRKDAEDALNAALHERDRKFDQRLEVTREHQRTMTNVAVLSSRIQESDSQCKVAAEELIIVQASTVCLSKEKQILQRQTMEADCWLDRWRSNREARVTSRSGYIDFLNNIPGLVEISMPELQSATCNFSNSFKLGEGGYGCVYKGELLEKTVAVKQFYVHNVQGPSHFQKEVQILGKIRHPHLITLIGACPEGCALVYDYMPNGCLHNRLLNRSNVSLSWKDRTRMVYEISCALIFLHSSYPEKMVHGDLKPENILLDSKLHCKLCDFGISRLVTEETLRCPSFRRYAEPHGAFPYTDPEFSRTGVLTPKSDVYSFGAVILQLLTGRSPSGLVADVRKAVSQRRLTSILDPSAGDWPSSVADKLANLGLDFCKSNSQDRPSLTPTIVRDLQKLHTSEERSIPSYFLCPIYHEIMLDPVVAADGHTYERETMCGWLENGRETSPLTNLPLNHLHLTPNHTLRRAIQDWLCKP